MQNAASLIQSDVVGVYITDVRENFDGDGTFNDDGFILEFHAFTNKWRNADDIETALKLYFYQIQKAGVIVQIHEPMSNTTFDDICDSRRYNPCRLLPDEITECLQRGIKGEGAICQCNRDMGYQTIQSINGMYMCKGILSFI